MSPTAPPRRSGAFFDNVFKISLINPLKRLVSISEIATSRFLTISLIGSNVGSFGISGILKSKSHSDKTSSAFTSGNILR